MPLTWEEAKDLDGIVSAAVTQCKMCSQYNLALAYELPVAVLDSEFVSANEAKAQKWISDPAPKELYFSHGEYFEGEKGIQYVINELRRKKGGRRALLSLLNMKDILSSGDNPIPAFMILQFAIDGRTLVVSAYFRALEVGNFLRINLTEICLHCRRIREHFGRIQKIRLLVLAFRAYFEEGFPCLEKAEIDQQPTGTIAVAVTKRKIPQIRAWLHGKMRPESAVCVDGMQEMLNAIQMNTRKYSPAFQNALASAVSHLQKVKKLREQASEGEELDKATKKFLKHLETALRELPAK